MLCSQAVLEKFSVKLRSLQNGHFFCLRDVRFIEILLYFHLKNVLKNYLVFKSEITGDVSILFNTIVFHCNDPDSIPCQCLQCAFMLFWPENLSYLNKSTVLFQRKSDNYYDLHLVNSLKWLVSTSKFLNKSHLIINFVNNKLPHK